MAFTICYSFEGSRVVFDHSAESLSDSNAYYLSLLHSGCAFHEALPSGGTFQSIQDYAKRKGITDLRWHKALVVDPYLPKAYEKA
ncbi:hypothetical protein [Pseudomonas sp.]|uniref:hypothetical protein n=1 Tax=Pseudomonas sp. TaxID=306 RepID=UPI003FD8920D